jgi:hypothetical protein
MHAHATIVPTTAVRLYRTAWDRESEIRRVEECRNGGVEE